MFGGQFPDRDARLFGVRGASLFQELDAADRLRRRGARDDDLRQRAARLWRSEEHTSELQSLMRISYAVFCLTKKNSSSEYATSLTSSHYTNYYLSIRQP